MGALAAILPVLLPVLQDVLSRVMPDPAAQAKALSDIVSALTQSDAAQSDINKAEATSPSLFVSGWRPFIGWVCGVGLAWTFVGHPVAAWILVLCHIDVLLPEVDSNTLMALVTAMLGLAGVRSYEKVQGVARK